MSPLAGDGGAGAVVGVHELLQQRRERRDRLIRRALGERAVEPRRGDDEGGSVVRLSGARRLGDGGAQGDDVLVAVLLRKPCGDPRLHQLASIVEVAEGRSLELERHGERLAQGREVGRRHHGTAAPTTPDRDQTLRLEHAQCLAQRGAGDAVRRRELLLRWEPLADLRADRARSGGGAARRRPRASSGCEPVRRRASACEISSAAGCEMQCGELLPCFSTVPFPR